MHLNDPDGRNLIAAERIRRLRGEAHRGRPPVGSLRRRMGALLVSAGARLAADEVPRAKSTRQSVL